MSQVDAKSFLERVTKNEAFRREVMSKLQEGAEGTPQQLLIHLGAQHGLTFTETELVDAWEESQSTDQRVLSDSELDGVAGGTLSDSQLDGVTGETASLKSLPKLLEAAVKGKVFKKVEIHGTATYGDAGEQVFK
jgi:predicted ribosomally synthesized peptide with nif11-like leader